MKKAFIFFLAFVFFSCAEKLMEKPKNLIPKEKMILLLNDLAVVNAAKTINAKILAQNGIEPTAYIFEKYGIDSIQFVESDRYYASIPEEHEAIYIAVEAKLEEERERLDEIKRLKDSVKAVKLKARSKSRIKRDSLLKNGDKKTK